MGKFDEQKFSSKKQDWTTPDPIFIRLNDEFSFTIDLAASLENRKVNRHYSQENDAMLQVWEGEIGWLNPPYGIKGGYSLEKWVTKAYKESRKENTTIVMLIPARTNTNWWHNYCMKAKEIRFIQGRIKFGDATHGLPQPLALIVFELTDNPVRVSSFKV